MGGVKHAGLKIYGTSKYAVHYFTESLALEAKETPVIVGSLRPGMVVTDLLTERYKGRPEEWERAKKIFNIIADKVENVTPWLAKRMLANQNKCLNELLCTDSAAPMRYLLNNFNW